MDAVSLNEGKQYEEITTQADNIDDVFLRIASLPKQQYTQQEIDEARENLAFMNDRVFTATFAGNKNNHIITETVNALRKIHALASIPPIERTTVHNVSLRDVFSRGMVGDLFGEGALINITVEVQKKKQNDYAVRGTLTSSNVMRIQFDAGDNFTEAPDVIGINILGFSLPELKNRKMFCSRIVRAEYESKETFLADKYSDYYIELPKMTGWTKEKLAEEYHDLWDLCCIFKAKIRDHEEVIRMQTITNPVALELSKEVKKAVAPSDFVNETLSRKDELEQLRDYFIKLEQKLAEKAAQKAEKKAEKKAELKIRKMIITALQCNTPPEVIEAMRENAGITEAQLIELKKQAQLARH